MHDANFSSLHPPHLNQKILGDSNLKCDTSTKMMHPHDHHEQNNQLTISGGFFPDDIVSPQVAAYFDDVEAGRIPAFGNLNPITIPSLRNANGETLLIAAARSGHV